MKRTAQLPDDLVRNQGPYKRPYSCLEGNPLQAAFLCLKEVTGTAEQWLTQGVGLAVAGGLAIVDRRVDLAA